MILTILFWVGWVVAGYFAVRMSILMLDNMNAKGFNVFTEVGRTVGWATPLVFLTGYFGWFVMMIVPEPGHRLKAHFISVRRVPLPSEKLVRMWFGVKS